MQTEQKKHDFQRINNIVSGESILELIGILLYNERRKRNKTLNQIGTIINTQPKTIDEVEIARTRPHWTAIEKLLKYYNKQIEIRLVERK